MKAIVYMEYGEPGVLHQEEVEKPYPGSNEVLIRVHAVSVNYGDIIARNFKNISPGEFNMPGIFRILARLAFGLSRPRKKILGNTFAGEVEMAGNEVKQFKAGEQVFGYTGEQMGTYAEYICLKENGILALKPSNLTYEEASAVPYGSLMALGLFRKVKIQKGQSVLIIGAAGGIGSAAVQLARYYFGAEVTAVCSTQATDAVRRLGADKVIDYKKEDFTKNGESYDLIFDILGKGSFSQYRGSLKQNGIYLPVSFKTAKLFQMLLTSLMSKKKVVCALAVPKPADLIFIKEFIEERNLKPVIDRCFPLEKTSDAHRYIETEGRKGCVVITMRNDVVQT